MMIDPETYYEEYLKGRTTEQLQTVIRSLKKEIGHLKNTMENPDYRTTAHIHPDESVQLWCTRLYLERAKQALIDTGGEYKPSRAEIAAAKFDANISAIRTFRFCIRGYFRGRETCTTLDGNALHKEAEDFLMPVSSNFCIPHDDTMTREEFLSAIKEMHIGEWRHSYNTERFGYVVCDGTHWEVEITYGNGHKSAKYHGDNAYPYNFDALKELLGITYDCSEEEESNEQCT